jgi:hypothetical protein
MSMPTLKKRVDVIWIAAALVAGAGGAVFAVSSSSADDNPAPAATADLHVAATADPVLASGDPAAGETAAKLAAAAGLSPAANTPTQTWKVGGRTVLGYVTAGGTFCFEFVGGAGGCLQPGVLTDEAPLDITTDYGPGTFNAYGLALDGVTAVTVRVGGSSHAAAFANNAFTFSDPSLGGSDGIAGEAIATMSDGSTRTVPFHVGAIDEQPVRLP